jgi:nitrite reductase/ring-hydroxylating ferredoxin subunit
MEQPRDGFFQRSTEAAMDRRLALQTLGISGVTLLAACNSTPTPGGSTGTNGSAAVLADFSSKAVVVVPNPGGTTPCSSTVTLTVKLKADSKKFASVVKVEFLQGATLLGTATATPYSVTVPVTADMLKNKDDDDEDHEHEYERNFTAKLYLKDGKVLITQKVKVLINKDCITPPLTDTVAPTVSLAASSASVTAAGKVTLTATAHDNAGGSGITKVDFYEGATLLGSAAVAPFVFDLNFLAANNGTHNYIAQAFDKSGNAGSSSSVTVVINIGTTPPADTTAPTVSLAASSLNVTAAGAVVLTATAADNAGGSGLAKVEFYEGATLLATKTAAPFTHSITFAAANNGSHVYSARAHDNANNTASSAPAVTVVVNIGAVVPPPTGPKIATYAQLAAPGSSIRFNHTDTTAGSVSIQALLYRSLALQANGVNANGMNLVAYQLDCSHKHCSDADFLAPTAAHILECSCHGALFNLENNASFSAPATKNLTFLKIEGRADGIYLV